jgi:ATP-dependent helicase/nuclease subunit A
LTPTERGTAFHLVMQHLPLRPGLALPDIEELLDRMVEKRLLTQQQRLAVEPGEIAAFCRTPLFARLCGAEKVWREVPFTYGIPAPDVYGGMNGDDAEDLVLIQGVVDCMFAENGGLALIDYKTDRLQGRRPEEAAEKHRFQVGKYAEAVGRIVGLPVQEAYVYFFEGGHAVRLL